MAAARSDKASSLSNGVKDRGAASVQTRNSRLLAYGHKCRSLNS